MVYPGNCETENERATADRHEEILAGLADERPHSRFCVWSGNKYQGLTLRRVQWTYYGNGEMERIRGMESQAFI